LDIIVKAKNCEIPPRLRDQAIEKVQHAARFFDRMSGVEMVFGEEHNPRIPEPAVVEVTGHLKGHLIRAQGHGGDHRAAIDAAVAKFERQLSRYKAKRVNRTRGTARPQPVGAALIEDVAPRLPGAVARRASGSAAFDGEEPDARIVRTKHFALRPMLPEDAALQLELLDHDFYLFTNAATGDCNLMYRRKDGDLGLIVATHEATPEATPEVTPRRGRVAPI